MTKDQVKSVLARIPTWPRARQEELAQLALDIEAELSGEPYTATADELAAIVDGLASESAESREVEDVFALFRRACTSNTRSALLPIFVALLTTT